MNKCFQFLFFFLAKVDFIKIETRQLHGLKNPFRKLRDKFWERKSTQSTMIQWQQCQSYIIGIKHIHVSLSVSILHVFDIKRADFFNQKSISPPSRLIEQRIKKIRYANKKKVLNFWKKAHLKSSSNSFLERDGDSMFNVAIFTKMTGLK